MGFIPRASTVLLGVPLLLGWLWVAKAYDQFWLVVLLIALAIAAAAWEYAKLTVQSGVALERFSFTIISILSIIAYGVMSEADTPLIFTVGALFLLVTYLWRSEGLKAGAIAILGLFYLPYLLHFFYPLYRPAQGFYYVLLLLVLVWAYDTGAYIVGSLFGKHKLWPQLSPKKSWEGVLGGWLLMFVSGWLALRWGPWAFSLQDAAWHGLALSLLISICAQLGDLFESKLKRMANVKDSGTFFPGHGGMLDRIDSLLFALPAFYSYMHYILEWV